MNITDIFIRRPVMAICINIIVLVAGLQAINTLTTRQYPRSDMAVVKVTTTYIGASSDLVRGYITTPLEKVIASADGIDYMESSSKQSVSEISAHLRLNYDTNDALSQIQAKIAEVRNQLPSEAEAPIISIETTDNRFASMYLSFYSEKLDPSQITDYLLRVIQPQLSAVPGVQKADILGARTFAMRVWLKPDAMAARGVSPAKVWQALRQNNTVAAPGSTKGSMVSIPLAINSDLQSVEEFRQLVVSSSDEKLVRLGDIADVVLGAEQYDEDVRFDGKPATFMGIWVLPNANSLEVIKAVRKEFPAIRANLPGGMQFGIPYDATKYIENSIDEVLKTLGETVGIVVLVIFLFIGSLRSVLVPVIAIPLSLLGGVALMQAMGFSLNLLTLLAIVLAVGLVVDDAIVMLENVERHVKEGLHPVKAALVSARELAGPIISMTITLAAVYAPIGIQGGLTGVLFREFAFTLAGAVFISGFVALTLSPVMAAMLVKERRHDHSDENWLQHRIETDFGKIQNKYRQVLQRALQYRPALTLAAVMIAFLALPFYLFSTKELAPKEDQGIVFGIVNASPYSTLEQTNIFTKEVAKVFKTFPEYATSFQLTGPSFGFSGMVVKPWSERSRTTEEMTGEAWGKAAAIPGIQVIMTTPAALPGGSNFPVELVITTTQPAERLLEYGGKLVGAAFASGKFMYADMDLKYDLPEATITLDREKIASMGLTLQDVAQDISAATGGGYANRFNLQGRSYKVIPQLERKARLNASDLLNLHVRGPNGTLIPLGTVAHIVDSVTPRELKRFQQLNSVTIQGAIPPGVSINDALTALETTAAEILPPGFTLDYAGESRQLRQEGSKMLATLGLALVLIYLVLAAQFESFRDPFIILAGSVPLALAGALFFSFLGFTTINIYSQVGLVTLVGLIAKNGILIVEFANNLREQGHDKMSAVVEAASTRLRPVLMTSVATVVGHFPLILATGAGAAARNSIGIMLVSGMIIGTAFTLFIVPTIYLLFSGSRHSLLGENATDMTKHETKTFA